MPFAPLLQQFVNDELAQATALIDRTRLGVIESLRQPRAEGMGAGERPAVLDLIEMLRNKPALYNDAFLQSLRKSALADLHEQLPHDPLGDLSGTLTLVDESRVESDIEISRVVQRIQDGAEWELRELQTFTSTLCGHLHVIADSNPLRPLFYARALWDAACAVTAVGWQRMLLLQAAAAPIAQQLKLAWAAAATRLENQGVKPGIYRTVVLAPGTAVERNTAHRPAAGDGVAPPEVPPQFMGGRGAARPAVPGAGGRWPSLGEAMPLGTQPARALRPELEESLLAIEDLLRNMPVPGANARRNSNANAPRLRDHQAQLNAGVPDAVDRQLIDLLSRLFDNVLSDVQLHPGLRALIARLQVSALRVALNDATMMEDRQHPVWQLMDLIGQASAPYTQPGDARLATLLQWCEAMVDELSHSSSQDGTLYMQALAQLESWLWTQLEHQTREARQQVDQLSRLERRNTLQQHMSQRLRDQVDRMRLSENLLHFVTDTWAQVLAESVQRFGEQGEPTPSFVKAMDDLLWSLSLPDHPQSRKRLLSLLPWLLQQLRAGMTLVSLPPTAQDTVMAELMAVHTEALRPGAREQQGGVVTPQSAEQIVQQLRDETLHYDSGEDNPRAFADSLIDITSMETVPAELIEANSPDLLTDTPQRTGLVADMKIGARRRIFLKGRWMRVQLLWRSPLGSLLLFASESAGRTHSITERALQRLLDEHLVLPLEDKTLVQRAIDALYRELS